MNNQNPATPAQAANPGSGEQVQNPSSAAPQAPTGNQGGQQEDKVSISLQEYRNLQRDHARVLSFEKRKQFSNKASSQTTNDGDDPQFADEIRKRDAALEETQFELHKERVTNRVRDILDKQEYKGLPKSTRDLILKNPAMLSESDDVEEALLDIEDFVREQMIDTGSHTPQNSSNGDGSRNATPATHETPPSINGGSPAPNKGIELEDASKLTGMARSRAILRNKMRESQGIKSN